MQQECQPDEADRAGDAARNDCHHLLRFHSDEMLVDGMRRQQTDEMAGKQEQDADMEEVASPP